MKKKAPQTQRLVIGWREWVSLPQLEIPRVKVKVDTGARTSSLHAVNLKFHKRGDETWVTFLIHPLQDTSQGSVKAEALVVDERNVKSSNGHTELRPVIQTDLTMGANTWPIELTLTSRDMMGFRMLLGREATRGKVLIDPGRSFLMALSDTSGPSYPPPARL